MLRKSRRKHTDTAPLVFMPRPLDAEPNLGSIGFLWSPRRWRGLVRKLGRAILEVGLGKTGGVSS